MSEKTPVPFEAHNQFNGVLAACVEMDKQVTSIRDLHNKHTQEFYYHSFRSIIAGGVQMPILILHGSLLVRFALSLESTHRLIRAGYHGVIVRRLKPNLERQENELNSLKEDLENINLFLENN